MFTPEVIQVIAWFATFLCVAFPARCAAAFLKHSPRLFSVLSLFALVWALLLPFYGSVTSTYLFPAFGGFLAVYIGGILRQEAQARNNAASPSEVHPFERLSLWIFGLLAAPTAVGIALPAGQEYNLSLQQSTLFIAILLDILGYLAIWTGIRELCSRRAFVLTGMIVVPYILLEIVYAWIAWPSATATVPTAATMGTFFLIAFALAKLLFTASIACLVSWAGMTPTDRQLPLHQKVMKFFGI